MTACRTRAGIGRFALVAFLVLASRALTAEESHWTPQRAIDVALVPSSLSNLRTRTVVLPGSAISQVPVFWTANDLHVEIIDNTLILQLRNPDFTGTLSVYDDAGSVFLLNVRPAEENERVDEMLIVIDEQARIDEREGLGRSTDTDTAVTEMMRHMLGGPTAEHITGMVVTRVENDEVRIGRRVFEDSDLGIWMVRLYQSPAVRGCELLFHFRGPQPVRFEMERLYFPGALAVYASDQVLYDPANPHLEIDPKQTIRVFYVFKD